MLRAKLATSHFRKFFPALAEHPRRGQEWGGVRGGAENQDFKNALSPASKSVAFLASIEYDIHKDRLGGL